ncbi:LbetaH domain-containing protein [Tumebacillus algifaecis]|nr:hypothetical protein [Tumebacillus algifaecis]
MNGSLQSQRFFRETQDELIKVLLAEVELVDIIPNLNKFILDYLMQFESEKYIDPTAVISEKATIEGAVYIGSNVKVQDFAYIKGPAIILNDTIIGKSAFVRDNVILGSNTIIGHSSEVCQSVILNGTRVAHFNAVSFSVVGSHVNLSSCAAIASYLLKTELDDMPTTSYLFDSLQQKVTVNISKFGAIIGDRCRLGANVIVNPGVVMEPNCIVYPQISLESKYYNANLQVYIPGYYAQIVCSKLKEEENEQHV